MPVDLFFLLTFIEFRACICKKKQKLYTPEIISYLTYIPYQFKNYVSIAYKNRQKTTATIRGSVYN